MSLCRCRATSPFSLSRCLAVYSDVSTARTGVSNSGVTLYRRYTHLHACTFWKRAHVDLPEPLPSSLSCVKKEREALSLVTLSLSDPLPPPFSAPPSSPALPSPCLSFFSLSRPPPSTVWTLGRLLPTWLPTCSHSHHRRGCGAHREERRHGGWGEAAGERSSSACA